MGTSAMLWMCTGTSSALSTPSIFCLQFVLCGALTKSSPLPSPMGDFEDCGHRGRPRKHSSAVEKHIKLHLSSRHRSGYSWSHQYYKENENLQQNNGNYREQACLKRWGFRQDLKKDNKTVFVISRGREFQRQQAQRLKVLDPMVSTNGLSH